VDSLVSLAAKQAGKVEELAAARTQVGAAVVFCGVLVGDPTGKQFVCCCSRSKGTGRRGCRVPFPGVNWQVLL
jgi:hypothetical protein